MSAKRQKMPFWFRLYALDSRHQIVWGIGDGCVVVWFFCMNLGHLFLDKLVTTVSYIKSYFEIFVGCQSDTYFSTLLLISLLSVVFVGMQIK